MRKLILLIVAIILLAAAAAYLLFRPAQPWSTESTEALVEFELGLEARMKYYLGEAEAHFQRALELDPDFVAAQFALLDCCSDEKEREALLEQLRRADQQRLSDRERFLVQYSLAVAERDWDERDRILQTYLDSHPSDPFALAMHAKQAWDRQDLDEAEKRFRRLLKSDPNWVLAQNSLGYIAMADGRFQEAEELFETYRYIAPDQANPHDSLGELLTLMGRPKEARWQLEKALAIKPDFCASYRHLLMIVILEGSVGPGDEIVERAADHCSPDDVERMRCQLELWTDFFTANYEGPWQEGREKCNEIVGDFNFILHRMEMLTGRREEALAREERIRAEIANLEERIGIPLTYPRGFLHYIEGARLAIDGDYEAAADRFEEADGHLLYWYEGQGILKLYNRLHLACALEQAGHEEEAREVIARVEAVNPRLAQAYPEIKKALRAGG